MWVNVQDKPIPTHGMHGKRFLSNLSCLDYYGHRVPQNGEVVIGIWDSINECFLESESGKEIDERDIVQWYMEE